MTNRVSHALLLLGLVLAVPFPASAQGKKYRIEKDEKEPVNTRNFAKDKSITVRFRVVDASTREPARDLPKGTIIIEEDGKEVLRQPWEGKTEPIWTVMVLDRSGSMKEGDKIEGLKRAARTFIGRMPSEQANLSIISFSDQVAPARPFTNLKDSLQRYVDNLKFEGETAIYDATYEAIQTLNAARDPKAPPGRRAVVAFTDGMDTRSRRRESDVIELAKSANIKVYMIGLGNRGELNEKAMAQIAQETGGEFFMATNSDELLRHFEQVATQHLQPVFELSFTSGRDIPDGTARNIVIRYVSDSGEIAESATAGYVTHGLITPVRNHALYLALLVLLLCLLAIPALLRRLTSGARSA